MAWNHRNEARDKLWVAQAHFTLGARWPPFGSELPGTSEASAVLGLVRPSLSPLGGWLWLSRSILALSQSVHPIPVSPGSPSPGRSIVSTAVRSVHASIKRTLSPSPYRLGAQPQVVRSPQNCCGIFALETSPSQTAFAQSSGAPVGSRLGSSVQAFSIASTAVYHHGPESGCASAGAGTPVAFPVQALSESALGCGSSDWALVGPGLPCGSTLCQ